MKLLILFTILAVVYTSSIRYEANVDASPLWVRSRKVLGHEKIKINFAVKNHNFERLEDVLNKVSDPESPLYGQHLTKEEVSTMTKNHNGIEQVVAWLRSQGIKAHQMLSKCDNFVRVVADAKTIENLIQAEYYHFVHPKTNRVIQRTASYSVPEEIDQHIDYVGGTNFMPLEKISPLVEASKPQQNGNTVPSLINSVYNIQVNKVVSQHATQSLFEGLGQSYDPEDLADFNQDYNLPNSKISAVKGPNDPSSCGFNPNSCTEASLDVQYMLAVAQLANTTFWSESNTDPEPFVDWMQDLCDDPNPPLVHSMSYGSVEDFRPLAPMKRFNQEAAKMGARGVTIVVSSGDDGVANFPARGDQSECAFNPSFPASSPYVLAVGATMGPEAGNPEIACTSDAGGLITTGGGFSTVWSQPAYQSQEVNGYLQASTNLPPKSEFASTGRGYPDIAAMGHNYEVVVGGVTYTVSGTSASAPVFAAMLTLVNDARIRAGKSPVGFVNPAIYKLSRSTPSAFHRIEKGENNCCAGNFDPVCCKYGFSAYKGNTWNPLTGLGSVDFTKFKTGLMNLL